MTEMIANEARELLDFWFGKPSDRNYGREKKAWFIKSAAFDAEVSRFLPLYKRAAVGALDDWQASPDGCLALVILLDQIPRNLFRHTPKMYATDDKALAIARVAIARGFDTQLLPVQRWFIYLPFEHSEDLACQQQAIALFSTLRDDPQSASAIDYAYRHYRVIERFGRFPHRNAILGRANTPEEEEFLQQPGSSF